MIDRFMLSVCGVRVVGLVEIFYVDAFHTGAFEQFQSIGQPV